MTAEIPSRRFHPDLLERSGGQHDAKLGPVSRARPCYALADRYAHIVLTEDQLNALGFAFAHMEELTRKLLDEFYALFERSKEASQ